MHLLSYNTDWSVDSSTALNLTKHQVTHTHTRKIPPLSYTMRGEKHPKPSRNTRHADGSKNTTIKTTVKPSMCTYKVCSEGCQ